MQNHLSKLKLTAGFLILTFLLGACTADNEESLYGPPVDCTQVSARFSTDVLPVIQSKCAYSGCHDATQSGGVMLTSYDLVRQYASRIRDAVFVQKIMPKQGELTTEQRKRLKCWLDAGAPNN
jgi:uncharacterized membrane protein